MPKIPPIALAGGIGMLGYGGYVLWSRISGHAILTTEDAPREPAPSSRSTVTYVTSKGGALPTAGGYVDGFGNFHRTSPTGPQGYTKNSRVIPNRPPVFAAHSCQGSWCTGDKDTKTNGFSGSSAVNRMGPRRTCGFQRAKSSHFGMNHNSRWKQIGLGFMTQALKNGDYFGCRDDIRAACDYDLDWYPGDITSPHPPKIWQDYKGFYWSYGQNAYHPNQRFGSYTGWKWTNIKNGGPLICPSSNVPEGERPDMFKPDGEAPPGGSPKCFNNGGAKWGPANSSLFDIYMEAQRIGDFHGGHGNLSIVPDVEFCYQGLSGDAADPLPNCTRFPALDDFMMKVSSKPLRGFQDFGGVIWTDTRDTVNYRHVSSEDNDIALLVSVSGWTAYNTKTRKRVPEGRALIRWKSFNEDDIFPTLNPWEQEPFQTINEQGRTVYPFNGQNWVIDYRTGKEFGNTSRMGWDNYRTKEGDPNWSAHLRYRWGGDGNSPSSYNVPGGAGYFCDQDGSPWFDDPSLGPNPSRSDVTVPFIHYGIDYPFEGVHGNFNALPYDFAAPLILQSFYAKPYRDLIFNGDL